MDERDFQIEISAIRTFDIICCDACGEKMAVFFFGKLKLDWRFATAGTASYGRRSPESAKMPTRLNKLTFVTVFDVSIVAVLMSLLIAVALLLLCVLFQRRRVRRWTDRKVKAAVRQTG